MASSSEPSIISTAPSSVRFDALRVDSSVEATSRSECARIGLPTTFRTPPECNGAWNITTIVDKSTLDQPATEIRRVVWSYRFMPYDTVLDWPSPSATKTLAEHKSCLPSITSSACPFLYVNADCPHGWKPLAFAVFSGIKVAQCCPEYVEFFVCLLFLAYAHDIQPN
jgi:hypothetical protein